MKQLLNSRMILAVTGLLALLLVIGGVTAAAASAQGPSQGNTPPAVLNNQAVLDLLKSTEAELLAERQANKSWLDIAAAQGVTQAALLDALLAPIQERHAWMAEYYPQFNAAEREEWMRTQFTADIQVKEFGTLTDRHVFGGIMGCGMGTNGFGGMYGRGMMGQWNSGPGSFGGMMFGKGMMRGWNSPWSVTPTPAE